MIEFTKYASIKDRYCLSYYGNCDEYLLQLSLLKPIIESQFKGIQIYIGCRDDKKILFKENDFVLEKSKISKQHSNFGYLREITFNGKNHPIEMLINECEIKNINITDCLKNDYTNKCVIITKGNYPTVSLDQNKINLLKKIAIQNSFEYFLDQDTADAGLVMGVESWGLFEAASRGIKTKLYPTGIGANLYKSMFPKANIISV